MPSAVIIAVLVPVLTLGLGGLMTEVGDWYRNLRKPAWNPPAWVFAPAWTAILGLAGWAGFLAWTGARDDVVRLRLGVLISVNVFFHLLWSPLFFKLKRPDLSLVEVQFLWLSILAAIFGFEPISVQAAWLLAPYLAWVTFATTLNLAIVRLNPPFGRKA